MIWWSICTKDSVDNTQKHHTFWDNVQAEIECIAKKTEPSVLTESIKLPLRSLSAMRCNFFWLSFFTQSSITTFCFTAWPKSKALWSVMSSNSNIPKPNTAVFSEVYPVEKVLGQCDIMHIIYIASTWNENLHRKIKILSGVYFLIFYKSS